MEPPDYLPISMLNQYLYCPRRFWYMYVHGEMDVNAAVLEGVYQHERAHTHGHEREGGAEALRRVYVFSDRLGLAGFVDLIEVEGGQATPVEYKHGRLGKWINFQGRNRRPPRDPVNALLSYGYVLLMNQVMSAIGIVGLDPYVGYLHASQYGKPALALDLMEEFRPIIVDSVVLTLINNRMIEAQDFEEEMGTYRLKERGRRTFLTRFEERLNEEIRHPVFDYRASYRRCLELQARLLAKVLLGEIPAYPPFIVR